MVYKIGSLAVAFVTVAVLTAQNTQATPKIAYINSKDIMAQVPGRTALEEQIKKELAPLDTRLKAMNDSAADMIKKYAAAEPTLSAEAKASRQKEITDKQRAWQVQADSLQRLAIQRQQALEEPMTALLKKILNDIRNEEGYWVIFDMADHGAGGLSIVAIDQNMNITQRVLDKYKAAAPAVKAGAPTTPPTPGRGPVNSTTGVRPPP